MADISNIRTLEDLINLVSQLYFNLDKLNALYYDMFINPTPMTLELERYDENGVLGTITLDNRAKDRQSALSGVGNPNGVQVGRTGALYIDTQTASLYYKGAGTDAYGWVEVWSAQNFRTGAQYLSPNGNGSQLVDLDVDHVTAGILSVSRGGTGSSNISGIVKANGTNPYTAAVDGVDYMGVNSMTGLVCYYPVATIPDGWLRCDGAEYSRNTYSKLYSKIGTTYGAGDGSTTFNVPNLMDYFIRCWDGTRAFNTVQQDQVGTHKHSFSGITSNPSSSSSMSIVTGGTSKLGDGAPAPNEYGWFIGSLNSGTVTVPDHTHTFSGVTEENAVDQETRVRNIALVPIIKY